ncbi:3241_t:CDS:2 [Cetraspora pellucida]|uniref:3241_t:CDS:1 n=1 Tax=Cetraspora pellucida TaxID=1433469 RepID=A0A9N9DSG3_9GLOM|nr:3241_t:CDS:2 [Cetraspora pellucida]
MVKYVNIVLQPDIFVAIVADSALDTTATNFSGPIFSITFIIFLALKFAI